MEGLSPQDINQIYHMNIINYTGIDKSGCCVISLNACNLPENSSADYNKIKLYLEGVLKNIVIGDYSIVYFHHGLTSDKRPPLRWMLGVYRQLDREYKKNIKLLCIVHPGPWVKYLMTFFNPFVSSKFKEKVKMCMSLNQLKNFVDCCKMCVPCVVKEYDMSLPSSSSMPFDTDEIQKPLYFGRSLESLHAENLLVNYMPQFIHNCMSIIRDQGLLLPGIFRLSVSMNSVNQVVKDIDAGNIPSIPTPYLASVIIKRFINSMPQPLLSLDIYQNLESIMISNDDEKSKENLKKYIDMLPECNYQFSKQLFAFLDEIASHSDENKMSARNLSIIFSVITFCSKECDFSVKLESLSLATNAFHLLLTNHQEFFTR